MKLERWKVVKELFQAALQHESNQRSAYLAAACDGDSALMAEVTSLLASHAQAGDFIERSMYEVFAGGEDTNRAADRATGPPEKQVVSELTGLSPDYELIRPCGEGSFGQVWIVRDRAGAYRAMKVIQLGKLAERNISNREMQALEHYCRNAPQHPNLVQVYHIGRNERWLYYTMELADDLQSRRSVRKELPEDYQPMTLYDVLGQGRLGTDTAVEIALRLLGGAACLHQAGLVHRDIKPANVIFVNREVKLADLSLVSVRRSQMSKAGTPRYMPPDECMDTTADTYALGKMLHEMISGGNLSCFPHLPEDERISSTKLDLEKLDAFLVTSCASNAAERFATAVDMRSALLDCRYPLPDALLLELAERELGGGSADSATALQDLQRAVGHMDDPDADVAGSSDSPAAHAPGTDLHASRTPAFGRRARHNGDAVWAVVDRLIKILPWLVVLVLGYYLIHRLTG